MANWKRREQEQEGRYFFTGTLYCTQRVVAELTPSEISLIYNDVIMFANRKNGIDYFQVYEDENGRVLYFIASLNVDQIKSGKYDKEDIHCTLLFSDEY